MSSKSKSQLRTENSTNFPNNNSQFITPEKLRGFNGDIIDSLVVSSDTGSYVTTSSFDNGTRIQTFTKADGTTYTNSIPDATVSTGSLLTTSSFDDGTRLMTFTKGDGSTYTNSIPGGDETGSLLTTASVVDATTTYTKGDGSIFTTTINNVVNATSASHAEQADNATSSSNSISSSVVSDPNIAYINKNNTFTGTQNFNNISVSGTGSFGYLQSVTGSAKIIGDAFIILNNDTPTERYAGIKVQDSGSADTTASLQYDGGTDDWFFEKEVSGVAEFGVSLFGPEYTVKGTPTYNTNNTIPKGTGGHHLNDSIITDNGSTVSIGGNLNVTGNYNGFDSSSFALKNAANTFTAGPQIISSSAGYLKQQMDFPGNGNQIYFLQSQNNTDIGGKGDYSVITQGIANYGFNRWYDNVFITEYYAGGYPPGAGKYGAEKMFNGGGQIIRVYASGSADKRAELILQDDFDETTNFTVNATSIEIGTSGASTKMASDGINIGSISSPVTINTSGISIDSIGVIGITGSVDINANLALPGISNVSESIASASVSGGGGASGIFIQTGSFYSTTNDLQVTGSFGVSKAIGGKNSDLTIASNTASIDLTQSNTYTVTLVSSADTHLDVSTFGETAQSVNVLVKQPAAGNTGSISFSPDFKFGQGYSYKPTPSNSSEDILSFTRFGNSLYGTYINNFN